MTNGTGSATAGEQFGDSLKTALGPNLDHRVGGAQESEGA